MALVGLKRVRETSRSIPGASTGIPRGFRRHSGSNAGAIREYSRSISAALTDNPSHAPGPTDVLDPPDPPDASGGPGPDHLSASEKTIM